MSDQEFPNALLHVVSSQLLHMARSSAFASCFTPRKNRLQAISVTTHGAYIYSYLSAKLKSLMLDSSDLAAEEALSLDHPPDHYGV